MLSYQYDGNQRTDYVHDEPKAEQSSQNKVKKLSPTSRPSRVESLEVDGHSSIYECHNCTR